MTEERRSPRNRSQENRSCSQPERDRATVQVQAKLLFIILVLDFVGCATTTGNQNQVVKRLLDDQAIRSAENLFGASYDQQSSRVVDASEIKDFIARFGVDVQDLPKAAVECVGRPETVGLLVPEIVPLETGDGRGPAILLPSGICNGYWLSSVSDCANGEPPCEHCGGCRGVGPGGSFVECICTRSCKICRSCPAC